MLALVAILAAIAFPSPGPWKVDLSGEWAFSTGDDAAWAKPDFDDTDWDVIHAPALWDRFGYEDYDGFGWYRRHFTAPERAARRPLIVEIGGVDDDDWVYINGRLVGQGRGCYKRRVYRVPPGVVRAGDNVIAVRIYDGAMGGGLAVGPIVVREETLADRVEISEVSIKPLSYGSSSLRLGFVARNKSPNTLRLRVVGELRDYCMRQLLRIDKGLVLKAGEARQLGFDVWAADYCSRDYRLSLRAISGDETAEFFFYPTADALAGPRKVWWLSGQWEFMAVERLEYPPRGGWKKIDVPHWRWGGWPGPQHSAWFRLRFTVPAQAAGQRFRLRFEAVAHWCEVYLNRVRLGEHLGGFEPFEFDVTEELKPGEENELIVGVTDWTAGLKPGVKASDPSRVPRHSMLIPFGTRVACVRGIWQDVFLVAHGPVAVVDTAVRTSVRQKRLEVRATLRNFSDRPQRAAVEAEVRDGGERVFSLRRRAVEIAPGKTAELTWSRQWANPRLWWPFDPHLYHLRLAVTADGKPSDQHVTRFGFREFWIDGIDYRLNGRIFRLRGLGCTSQHSGREEIRREYLADMNEANITLMRNHMYPRPKYYYDIADEVGMCLKDESAFYCRASEYALDDERLWGNLRRHIAAMVVRARNHPSVLIWSTENEILHCGGAGTPGTDERIFELGQLIARLDPARPVEFEGDGDVNGRAATVNIHYPREFGCHDHNLWPNDAWWLGKEGNDRWPRELIWRKDKPLIIGEFCYYPYSRPPGGVSIFVGERAYASAAAEREAHVMGVRFICEGARWAGAAGLNPWVRDHVYGGVCLPPVAVLARQWDHCFWVGETVPRDLLVLNDTLQTRELSLIVAVMKHGSPVWRWARDGIKLEPGGRLELTVDLRVPQQAGRYTLVYRLREDERVVYDDERPLTVAAQRPLAVPPGLRVAIYDPGGASTKALADAGLVAKALARLSAAALTDVDLLIVGRDAWAARPTAGRETLGDFVRRGGKVLVLPQTRLPGWLPTDARVDTKHAATMTYAAWPGHPLLRGVSGEARELCWWSGDHLVARALLTKPTRGNFRIVAEAGARGGLRWTPLLELPDGRGWWVLCQYAVDEKCVTEPTARRLLQNVLHYAAEYRAPEPAALLAHVGDRFAEYLRSLGAEPSALADPGELAETPAPGVVVVDGARVDESLARKLRRFAEAGGTVWVHAPDGADERALSVLAGAEVKLRKVAVRGRLVKTRRGGLLAGVSNSDVFWYREDCWHKSWEGGGGGMLDQPATLRLVARGASAYFRPPSLVEIPCGRGRVIIDTLRLEHAEGELAAKARRIGAAMLTNMGVELGAGAKWRR